MPAIGSDGKLGTNFHHAVGSSCPRAHDASILLDKLCRLSLHLYLKTWITPALLDDEVQKIPLRHQREKLAMGWKMSEVGDLEHVVANLAGKFRHLLMRAPQELLQKTKFMDQLQRGRMNGVATKIAQKVSVLFEDNNIHTRASQQKTKHHSSGASANDAASRIDR